MNSIILSAALAAMVPNPHGQSWDQPLGGLRGHAIGTIGNGYLKNGEGSIVRLADGRLLHAFTRHELDADLAPAVIAQSYSSDGGRSWSEPSVMFTSATGKNVMQPGFVRMKNGELGVSYSQIDSASRAVKLFRYSRDEGRTWSRPIRISPDDGYWTSAHDRMLLLPSGRILLPLHHKTVVHPEKMVAQVAYSDDNGRSWVLSPDEITTDAMLPGFRKKFGERVAPGFWEASIARRADGTLLMMGRTYGGFQYESVSADGGVHWSRPSPSPIRSPAAPARLVRVPGSADLLVIWNSCCVQQNDSLLGERLTLSSAISHDGGKSWHLQRDIEAISPGAENRVEYPTVTFLDGTAYVTYQVQELVGGTPETQEYLSILPTAWFYVGSNSTEQSR